MKHFSSAFTRRAFIRDGIRFSGMLGSVSLIPRAFWTSVPSTSMPAFSIRDPEVKALVQRALDAARSAGATYVDVRLTYTKQRIQRNMGLGIIEGEYLHAGVRAVVNGYWGFAASSVWSPDEMVRLGQEAVHQAKVNDLGKPRELVLPPVEPVIDGHWETPVKIDGFQVHPVEVSDYLMTLRELIRLEFGKFDKYGRSGKTRINIAVHFTIQEKAFGSTDGTYCTQRLHRTEGEAEAEGNERGASITDLLTLVGKGWELITEMPVVDLIRQRMEENAQLRKLPVKLVDVGKYDAVFDARSVAALLSRTIGVATEIDRALGYEANAGGTSYLNDPVQMLDTFQIGTPQLTVRANRSEPNGLASTGWDDEGVKPSDVVLVEQGVVRDFQTSREGAGWLQPVYARTQRPFRSHGFSFAEFGTDAPMVHTGNLVMQPGSASLSHADLEASITKGMLVTGASPAVDFQCLGGMAMNFRCFELKGGKRVARVANAGILFRTVELWKSLLAVGGASSARRYGMGGLLTGVRVLKGEPEQHSYHSVTAVPIAVKDVTFIDAERR